MYTITIKAKCGDVLIEDKYQKTRIPTTTDLDLIAKSAVDTETFADYFDDEFRRKLSTVSGGEMSFQYVDGQMYVLTTYDSSRELTEKEQKMLIGYTQGQWSDGIGKHYEQFPCCYISSAEVFISPWYRDQVATYSIQPQV